MLYFLFQWSILWVGISAVALPQDGYTGNTDPCNSIGEQACSNSGVILQCCGVADNYGAFAFCDDAGYVIPSECATGEYCGYPHPDKPTCIEYEYPPISSPK